MHSLPQTLNRRQYLAAVGGSAVLAGCVGGTNSNSDERPPLSDRTLRYGAVLPLSGALEAAGKTLTNATELPTAELEGSIEAEIEYDLQDSKTTPIGAVDAARALIDDGYPGIVGAAASDATLQMTQQATIPAEVVSCSPSSTTPTLSILSDRGYSFRTAPVDSLQAVIVAQLATTDHSGDTAATLYAAGDYGRQLSGAFSASFDGEIQEQVPFSPDDDIYDDPLSEALAGEPDILFVIGYPDSGIPLLQTYYDQYADDELLFLSDGLVDETVSTNVEFPQDVYGAIPASAGPGQEAFVSLYRDEYNADPGLFAANSYDAAATILLANAAAGQNSGTAIAEQMTEVTVAEGTEIKPGELSEGIERAAAGEQVQYRGASGEIEFDKNGDGGSVQYEYVRFGNSGRESIETLTPSEVRS